MKKINDNEKIALALERLKRLVESVDNNDKFVTIRVDIEWDIDTEGDEEEYNKDEYDIPSTVYIKIPRNLWSDQGTDLDISDKLSDLYGFCVNNLYLKEVTHIEPNKRVLYWTENGLKGSL